jgi:regulator of replication initiation timing
MYRCRKKLINYTNVYLHETEKNLNDLAEQIKEMLDENELNEINLNQLKQRLQQRQEKLLRPSDVSIEQQLTSFLF